MSNRPKAQNISPDPLINKNDAKLNQIQSEIDATTGTLKSSIGIAMNNLQTAESTAAKSEKMKEQAAIFRKQASQTKWAYCWQHYRNILILLVILAVIGVVLYLVLR
eukprot:TRINITY_DN965_c0_g2_i1.p1 TRINITY_DN965_c0_g2~~TRINITY_DN965_c0_g2_i1.p1  ORF type:complete len:124 (-),score=41.64 TRINITY_DN965_c0_g2_i1:291-611(-)